MGEIPVKCFLRLLSLKTTHRDADAVQPQSKAHNFLQNRSTFNTIQNVH